MGVAGAYNKNFMHRRGRAVLLGGASAERGVVPADARAGAGDDFPALAEHLYQLAARARGTGIARVIFERAYLPRLFATARGPYLEQNLKFMKGKPWVRHDEHYHVDFAVRCKPLER